MEAKQFKSVLSLSLRSDAGGLLSVLLFFSFFFLTLSSSDRQARIIILIQHRYVRPRLVMLISERKAQAKAQPEERNILYKSRSCFSRNQVQAINCSTWFTIHFTSVFCQCAPQNKEKSILYYPLLFSTGVYSNMRF